MDAREEIGLLLSGSSMLSLLCFVELQSMQEYITDGLRYLKLVKKTFSHQSSMSIKFFASFNAFQGNASGDEHAQHTGVLANGLIDAAWEFVEHKSVLPQHPPSGS